MIFTDRNYASSVFIISEDLLIVLTYYLIFILNVRDSHS